MKKSIGLLLSALFLLGFLTAYKLNLNIGEVVGLLFPLKLLYWIPLLLLALFIISLVGIPAYTFYLLFEVFTMGFIFYLFWDLYNFKAISFLLIFFVLGKIPLFFLLILNTFYAFKFSKSFYRFLFNRFGQSIRNIKLYFKKMMIINIIFYLLTIFDVFLLSKLMTLLAKYLLF